MDIKAEIAKVASAKKSPEEPYKNLFPGWSPSPEPKRLSSEEQAALESKEAERLRKTEDERKVESSFLLSVHPLPTYIVLLDDILFLEPVKTKQGTGVLAEAGTATFHHAAQ